MFTQRPITSSSAGRRIAGAVFALTVCTIGTASAPEKPRFVVEDLGTLGGLQAGALAMSDEGLIVGWSETRLARRPAPDARRPLSEVHATMWMDGTPIDLRTLGGPWSEARDVNARGEIVGVSETPEGVHHAFYVRGREMYELNDLVPVVSREDFAGAIIGSPLPVRTIFEANGINDAGWIVGCATLWGSSTVHGLLLVPTAPADIRQVPLRGSFFPIDLGRLAGAGVCLPLDVNERGIIVGSSGDLPFVWDGRIRQLDTRAKEGGTAYAICNDNIAVGSARVGGFERPVLWVGFETYDLAGDFLGRALDLNDAGRIVGWTAHALGAKRRATLWTDSARACYEAPPSTMRFDLTALSVLPDDFAGGALTEAAAIDARGRIAGTATLAGGAPRAFVAIPVAGSGTLDSARMPVP
jgi:probable HAF family extracellular repeat protein